MSPKPPFTFRKSHRLRGSSAFDAVFAARMRKSLGPLALHSRPNALAHNRLGLAVPRKVGKAHKRNRIKRLLRESFRLSQHDLPQGYDLVLLVHPHEVKDLEQYTVMLGQLAEAAARGWAKRNR